LIDSAATIDLASRQADLTIRVAARRARYYCFCGLLLLGAATTKDFTILLLALPIGLISLFAVSRNDNPSVDAIDMFWFMHVIFFFIRPVQSLVNGSTLLIQGVPYINYDWDVILTAFFCAYIASFICLGILPTTAQAPPGAKALEPNSRILFVAGVIGFVLAVIFAGGPVNFLQPRFLFEGQVSPVVTITKGMLGTATFLFYLNWRVAKPRDVNETRMLWFLMALLALSFNPVNVARFMLIAAWMPIVLVAIPVLRKPLVFFTTTLVAMIVAMPILSTTSRYGLQAVTAFKMEGALWELPYIDVFDVLLHGIYYVERLGYFFGEKLVAILLFFVPRAWWPDKPIVSALDVGNDLYTGGFVGTPNLSMSVIGDFYMDFGLAGVAVGSVVICIFFRLLLGVRTRIGGEPALSLLLMSSLPILTRGAIGAVLPVFFSAMVSYLLLTVLARKKDWLARTPDA
jgi:hypothetical protein